MAIINNLVVSLHNYQGFSNHAQGGENIAQTR